MRIQYKGSGKKEISLSWKHYYVVLCLLQTKWNCPGVTYCSALKFGDFVCLLFPPEEFQVVLRGSGLTLGGRTDSVTCTYQVNGTTIRKCGCLRPLAFVVLRQWWILLLVTSAYENWKRKISKRRRTGKLWGLVRGGKLFHTLLSGLILLPGAVSCEWCWQPPSCGH